MDIGNVKNGEPDFNMVWMNQGQMMMPDDPSLHQQMSADLLGMDQNSQIDSSYYPMQIPTPFETVPQQPMELDGFLMMDDYEGDFDDGPPQYMTTATQTLPSLRRKILPIMHPGLKLQTPIAFKCDTDPNVIPIQKDGMATCQKCGAYGVKHSFYTRFRKYCSTACARSVYEEGKDKDTDEDSMQSHENSNPPIYKFDDENEIKSEELITNEVLPLATGQVLPSFNLGQKMAVFPFTNIDLADETVIPPSNVRPLKDESYDWLSKINSPRFSAASVQCFKHAPMSDSWDNVSIGMKVEVETSDDKSNNRLQGFSDSFWVATVMRIAGYKALLRYDGCDMDRDFWVNLCCCNVHPVGWCATRGKPLIPPKCIAENRKDWKEFLVKRLTGARTLPSNFHTKIAESMKSRFRVGLRLEVVNKDYLSEMCVATVRQIVGKRLLLHCMTHKGIAEFWCNEDSPLIHPVGWAYRVGHAINATPAYCEGCESGLIDKDDATEELFTAPCQSAIDWSGQPFREKMKLEAIDPLNLGAICVATVTKVLKYGYIMVRIDSYSDETDKPDSFCYHASSPYIFPPGFCRKNGITLVPPVNYNAETFSWETYRAKTNCVLAPPFLFQREPLSHGINAQMSLECTDLMEPRLICVASVVRVVGRLLKIHFDGWEDDFDQWMDCTSPDMYPVGWCNLVSYKLEGPRSPSQKHPEEKKKPGRRPRRSRVKPLKKQVQIPVEESPHEVDNDSCPSQQQLPDYNCCLTEGTDNTVDCGESDKPTSTNPAVSVDGSNVLGITGAAEDTSAANVNVDALTISPSLPVPSSSAETNIFIPRLSDASNSRDSELNPSSWSSNDVVSFLKVNDCGVYADKFLAKEITGSQLLPLTQDEIMELAGKTGPALKIFALIQQLKARATKASRRFNL